MKKKYSTFVESIIDASSGEKLKLGEENDYLKLLESCEELESKGLGYWVQDEFIICKQDEELPNE